MKKKNVMKSFDNFTDDILNSFSAFTIRGMQLRKFYKLKSYICEDTGFCLLCMSKIKVRPLLERRIRKSIIMLP